MAKAEPKPSTARARTVGQADSGTGPHSTTPPRGDAKLSRADDRPSKSAAYPGTSKDYDGKSNRAQTQSVDLSQRAAFTAPEPDMPAFVMLRDSGPKTAREREFAATVSPFKSPLDGSDERAFFPSGLEQGTQAEIAKGDKYAGTKTALPRYKKQAQ